MCYGKTADTKERVSSCKISKVSIDNSENLLKPCFIIW